jgi:glyoxylate/hydroxypyruvate reductase A
VVLVVQSGGAAAVPEWRSCFAELVPDLEVLGWDDPALRPDTVDYALVWDPDPTRLAALTSLRAVFCSGAGVEHLVSNPGLKAGVPVVRCVPPEAGQRMGEYVCWAVLALAKEARRAAILQAERRWEYYEPYLSAANRRVGIMGMGHMGQRTAEMLRGLGIQVHGWSRSRKSIPGVQSFAGAAEFDAFLAISDVLVCLLPATPETDGLIAAPLLSKLPKGAGLVQAGRGAQQVVPDILAALDSGQLSGAVIDVFAPEPLPPEDPAWTHPGLIVTPHLASVPNRPERARYVAAVIQALRRGEAPAHLYDHARGY